MTAFNVEEIQRGFLSVAPSWLLFEKAEPADKWVEVTGRLQGSGTTHIVGVRNEPPIARNEAAPTSMFEIGEGSARALQQWFERKGYAPV